MKVALFTVIEQTRLRHTTPTLNALLCCWPLSILLAVAFLCLAFQPRVKHRSMQRRQGGFGQTLKQKLSSLSLAAAAAAQGNPTSPRSDDSSSNWAASPTVGRPSPFKKGLFAWNRKEEEEEEYIPTQDDIERVESCLDRIICQAGVDFE